MQYHFCIKMSYLLGVVMLVNVCATAQTLDNPSQEHRHAFSSAEEYRDRIEALEALGTTDNLDEIERLSDEAIQQYPRDDYFYRQKMFICFLREDTIGILVYSEKAYDLNPNCKNASNFAQSIAKFARIAHDQSDQSNIDVFARQYYNKGLECTAIWLQSEEERLEALSIRGLLHHTFREYELALTDFNDLIQLAELRNSTNSENVSTVPYYYHRALTYQQLGELDAAIDDLRVIIESGSFPSALRARAVIYYEKKAYQQAITDSTQAVQLSSFKPEDYEVRGTCYRMLGDYNKAIADFQMLTKLLPEDFSIHLKLAILLVEDGRRDEAYAVAMHTRSLVSEGSSEYKYVDMFLVCLASKESTVPSVSSSNALPETQPYTSESLATESE